MAYKCSNDGAEFQSKKELVAHMIDKYNSPFIEGDEALVELSKQHIEGLADAQKKNVLSRKYEDNGVDAESKKAKAAKAQQVGV